MKAAVHRLARGDRGTEQTLRHMHRLVVRAQRQATVIEWAQSVVRRVRERDRDGEAAALLAWVRSHMRYTRDPLDAEVVKTPGAMLREIQRHGIATLDCDDASVLLAAGLAAVGLPFEFVVVGRSGQRGPFSHVLVRYLSPRRGWVTMDPIVRGTAPGWFPEGAHRAAALSGDRLRGIPTTGGLG